MRSDFCVWILESDGLRVSPFDRHADGNHRLRSQGLDVETWRRWVRKVVKGDLESAHAFRDLALKSSARFLGVPGPEPNFATARTWLSEEEVAQFQRLQALFAPPALWPGSAAVGEELQGLWELYRWTSGARRAEVESDRPDVPGGWYGRLIDEGQARIPGHLWIRLVNYPGPAAYSIAPSDIVMGLRGWKPDTADFRSFILQAVDRLAETTM
jgi:hypothetical protein